MQMCDKLISSALVVLASMLSLSGCASSSANRASNGETPSAEAPCSIQTYQSTKFTVSAWKDQEPLLTGIGNFVCTEPALMIFAPGTKSMLTQSDDFYLSPHAEDREVGALTSSAVKSMGLLLEPVGIGQAVTLPEGESQLVTWITSPKSDEPGGTASLSGKVQISALQGEPADMQSIEIGSNVTFQKP